MSESIIPVMVGMGIMDIQEGMTRIMEAEDWKDRWNKWEMNQLMIGASKDYPDGIYAQGGSDLVCMTNEEYRHWHV